MSRRGQLVLLAAVALALALVPMTLAYLQLGYHADGDAATVDEERLSKTEVTLSRAVDDASTTIPAAYTWSNRSAAIQTVRDRLRSTIGSLNTSRLPEGTVFHITYNQSRASRWASNNCPHGPNRDFGSCSAEKGVVVQNRRNETHVLAAVFDVEMTTQRGDWRTISVVRTAGRW